MNNNNKHILDKTPSSTKNIGAKMLKLYNWGLNDSNIKSTFGKSIKDSWDAKNKQDMVA